MSDAFVNTAGSGPTAGGIIVRPPNFIIKNVDPVDTIFFGFTNLVTTVNGFPVKPGEIYKIELNQEQYLWVISKDTADFVLISYTA